MATGTAQREAEGRLAKRVDCVLVGQVHVVDRVKTKPPRDGEKAGGRDPLGKGLGTGWVGQQVACNLLPQKLVIGLVSIEGRDHIVAILPGQRGRIVTRFTGRVGVSHQIEPMPPPSLTIGRAGEQPIDHPGKGIRRGVVAE